MCDRQAVRGWERINVALVCRVNVQARWVAGDKQPEMVLGCDAMSTDEVAAGCVMQMVSM